jgi:hypothetical protein
MACAGTTVHQGAERVKKRLLTVSSCFPCFSLRAAAATRAMGREPHPSRPLILSEILMIRLLFCSGNTTRLQHYCLVFCSLQVVTRPYSRRFPCGCILESDLSAPWRALSTSVPGTSLSVFHLTLILSVASSLLVSTGLVQRPTCSFLGSCIKLCSANTKNAYGCTDEQK